MAARPDMTAHWESVLTQISEKQCRYQDFMQPLVGTLFQLIDQAKRTPVRQFRGIVAPGRWRREEKEQRPVSERRKKPAVRRGERITHRPDKAFAPSSGNAGWRCAYQAAMPTEN